MWHSYKQTLTDLSDYLAPSQICIKPATLVEDESIPIPTPIEAEVTRKATGFAVVRLLFSCRNGDNLGNDADQAFEIISCGWVD